MVKGYVKQKNTTFKIDDVQQLLNTAIERVTPQNWKNFIKHVIEEEDRIWKADTNGTLYYEYNRRNNLNR